MPLRRRNEQVRWIARKIYGRPHRVRYAHGQSSSVGWRFPDASIPPSADHVRELGLPLLYRAAQHAKNNRILLNGWPYEDGNRNIVSYQQVLSRASLIKQELSRPSYSQERGHVAQLCVPGWEYISSLWGSWAAGHACVPLAISQKVPEIEHVLFDSQPEVILLGGGTALEGFPSATQRPPNQDMLLKAADNLGMQGRILRLEDLFSHKANADTDEYFELGAGNADLDSPALVMYTSGTTGKPKGVVSTHRGIFHQVTDLVDSWQWKCDDVALHVLPLHHVHGVINILSCAAYCGARLDFQPFDAINLWSTWASVSELSPRQTVFMAVPTIFAKLLETAENLPEATVRAAVGSTLKPMRLMVSGSAALPVSVLERWRELTGHTLLERYGMTEFAMALSNPYKPVTERHPGHVGLPLPSASVRLVDDETGAIILEANRSGNLQVKGPIMFQKYLNRPEATREAFDVDGFFQTGDVAEFNDEISSYRILGRQSTDILKVGGYKLSALDIEREILEHPDVAEVAIVGVADETWGERVGMLCRLKVGSSRMTLESLRHWCETRMAKYKVPSKLRVVKEIPKNAMGKVNKKSLVKLFEGDDETI